MKKNFKKIAALTLAGALALGSLSGCSNQVDGDKTAVTVNDDEIKMGTVNLMLRYQQAQTAQMYEMYFGGSDGIWDNVTDEKSGETYGEQTVDDVVEQVENMVILRQHAKDYKVSISDEEQKKITAAAKSFLEANDENTLARLGVDQAQVEELLSLYYYNTKMYDPITKDADMNVSDEEAAQTSVTYIEVADDSTDEETDEEADTEDAESEDDKDKEDNSKELKDKAQQILEQVLATADADMDAIAKSVDENLSAVSSSFSTNPPEKKDDEDEDSAVDSDVPEEVQKAVKDLTDGEVAGELVEADGTYYIVRLDAAFDEEATESQKTTIQNERKQNLYEETTEKWRKDSDIKEEKNALKKLVLRDNDKYTFKPVETPEAEDSAAEETEAEDGEIQLEESEADSEAETD